MGQLIREQQQPEASFIIGFGSYSGTVIAAEEWGAVMREMPVPEARKSSWEALLHRFELSKRLILLDQLRDITFFMRALDHRAIGVVYHPEQERYGNYVPSILPQRYDAFIYVDQTQALHPLQIKPHSDQAPETYPWGV